MSAEPATIPTEGWPETPTHHGPASPATGGPIVWRVRDNLTALDHPYRTCSYCGSIHPQDLLVVLGAGGRIYGSDQKYGFPHKYYVDVPNARAGEDTRVGSESGTDRATGERYEREMRGPAPATVMGKFYTKHLLDQGYSPEARDAILAALTAHSGVEWVWSTERGVEYREPYPGYQKI